MTIYSPDMVTASTSLGTRKGRAKGGLARSAKRAAGDLDPVRVVGNPGSPWLTSYEACEYLRFTGKHKLRSLYKFIERTGVNVSRRGRSLLLKRSDLDDAVGA